MQYASSEYVGRLEEVGAQIRMFAVGNPYENAKAESFFRTLKRGEVHLKDYATFEVATIRLTLRLGKVHVFLASHRLLEDG